MTADHEARLASAFDGQAAAFERAPIQTDAALLSALVEFAAAPEGGLVLDVGCGPGLVCEALLRARPDVRVVGCDVSAGMVARAAARCAFAGARAEFRHASLREVAEGAALGPVDLAVSRLVLHHAPDPAAFVAQQVALLRPGGALVLADHIGDADPALSACHRRVEAMRDRTHSANLSAGAIVDLLAGAGLGDLRLEEHLVATDFEEWFARGTPSAGCEECRAALLDAARRGSRAWRTRVMPNGNVWMEGPLAFVRGVAPAGGG